MARSRGVSLRNRYRWYIEINSNDSFLSHHPPGLAPMDHFDYLERLRQYVRATLEELGADTELIQETILLRGGHYCGRRFRAGEHLAIWFSDENEVKFYAPTNGVVRVVRPTVLADLESKKAA